MTSGCPNKEEVRQACFPLPPGAPLAVTRDGALMLPTHSRMGRARRLGGSGQAVRLGVPNAASPSALTSSHRLATRPQHRGGHRVAGTFLEERSTST